MMKRIIVGLLLWSVSAVLVLSGAITLKADTEERYNTQGVVRQVVMNRCWNYGCDYSVIIEADNGIIFSIPVYLRAAPAVWPGLHAVIAYGDKNEQYNIFHYFAVVKKLD